MIHLHDVTYQYPATHQPALHSVNLEVPRGQFCAVVGANQAGKSTLCHLLAGFIPHFYHGELRGLIQVAGHDVRATTPGQLAGTVGLVFQNPFNQITGARYTVREEIAFGLENLGVPPDEMAKRIEHVLSLTQLDRLAERSPITLSGGEQQRLALASVIVMQPDLLVLDEPTTQLDPIGTRHVFAIIADLLSTYELAVILTSHKLEWIASYAHRVIALSRGRIVADGPPHDVLVTDTMLKHNIGQTQYTRVAVTAVERGLVPDSKRLPVTLQEGIEFLG